MIRLMSSNIWGDYFGNEVAVRDRQLEKIYRKYFPDILGLQEMTPNWWKSEMWSDLSDEYEFVPVPTNGKNNYVPMLYRKSTVKIMDSGWHLYHEKLDRSKGYTWAVFREYKTNQLFAVFNTHFWWKEDYMTEHDVIRYYNAMELVTAMKKIGEIYDCPVFFMGDLNCREESLAWDFFKNHGWETSYRVAKEYSEMASWRENPERGEDGFYHGKTTEKTKEKSIDHIGMKKESVVLKQEIVIDQEALDASDHCPIFADIELEG